MGRTYKTQRPAFGRPPKAAFDRREYSQALEAFEICLTRLREAHARRGAVHTLARLAPPSPAPLPL